MAYHFTGRSRSWLVRDVLEVSGFVHVVLTVPRVFDYAGRRALADSIAVRRVASHVGPSQHPVNVFRKLNSPPTLPLLRFERNLRASPQDRAKMESLSPFCSALPPLQLPVFRRTPTKTR